MIRACVLVLRGCEEKTYEADMFFGDESSGERWALVTDCKLARRFTVPRDAVRAATAAISMGFSGYRVEVMPCVV
jgi:hypothetical protein